MVVPAGGLGDAPPMDSMGSSVPGLTVVVVVALPPFGRSKWHCPWVGQVMNLHSSPSLQTVMVRVPSGLYMTEQFLGRFSHAMAAGSPSTASAGLEDMDAAANDAAANKSMIKMRI